MSEAKFTKGPWRVDNNHERDVQDSNGNEICTAFSELDLGCEWTIKGTITQSEAEAEANAHLIAAAPELYEALEEAAMEIRYLARGTTDGYDAIMRLLAKARGEK